MLTKLEQLQVYIEDLNTLIEEDVSMFIEELDLKRKQATCRDRLKEKAIEINKLINLDSQPVETVRRDAFTPAGDPRKLI